MEGELPLSAESGSGACSGRDCVYQRAAVWRVGPDRPTASDAGGSFISTQPCKVLASLFCLQRGLYDDGFILANSDHRMTDPWLFAKTQRTMTYSCIAVLTSCEHSIDGRRGKPTTSITRDYYSVGSGQREKSLNSKARRHLQTWEHWAELHGSHKVDSLPNAEDLGRYERAGDNDRQEHGWRTWCSAKIKLVGPDSTLNWLTLRSRIRDDKSRVRASDVLDREYKSQIYNLHRIFF